MKRSLLRTIYGFTLLLFSVALQAQDKADPSFNVVPPAKASINKSAAKLSPDLQRLADKQVSVRLNSAARTAPVTEEHEIDKLIQVRGNNVVLDITVKGDAKAARTELKKLGFIEKAVFGRLISGLMPITSLPLLEKATSIKFARPAYKPMHQSAPAEVRGSKNLLADPVKPVISQGDTAQRSYLARQLYNVDGKGVKVGVLSDSYNNLAGADSGVLKGELPGPGNPFGYVKPVQVLSDLADSSGIDEGRGMVEIVHDVAPASEIYFHTAFDGQADFAQGIIELAEAGCKVINDDVFYYAEPYFQDGIIAQAVDYVKKKGVTYFSAAGNNGNYSYESNYRPSVDTPFGAAYGTAHNFSAPGARARYFQPIRLPRNATTFIIFQWDQSFYSHGGSGADTDLDIYLLNSAGNVIEYSNEDNLATGDPIEGILYTNRTLSDTVYISILKYGNGPDPQHVKYILYDAGTFIPTNPAIPGIGAGTIVGHAKAEGAIATAAVPFYRTPAYRVDTPRVENFSSLGGVAHYIDVNGNRIAPVIRRKPEITTPDGGNTSFFPPFANQDITQDTDRFPNFFGTSAAAPHAAGIAALMIQAQKLQTITPNQIKGVLSSHTVDMDNIYTLGFDKGFDFNTGTGLVKADEAVNDVRFPNQYVKNLTLQALCSDNPAGTRNWKIINPNSFEVSVRWFITGDQQNGVINVAPGEYTFSTNTFYLFGRTTPNIAVIEWQDNFAFPHFDIKSSNTAKCLKDIVNAAGARQATEQNVAADVIEKANLAEVFPNPSRQNFRVYLSLAQQYNIDLELYTVDGRRLYKKTLQSNGIHDIDASGYKPGVYFLKIRQGEFSKTLKLIRQ